jgi:hypothetical protein
MILIDSNILVFAHNRQSPHHLKANLLLKNAVRLEYDGCITHQNLLEFFSVITNPKRVEKQLEFTKAISLMEAYWNSSKIVKIYPTPNTLSKALQLSKKYGLAKAEIFDCYLAATMIENGVFEIYTENISHFAKYPEIKAVNPL